MHLDRTIINNIREIQIILVITRERERKKDENELSGDDVMLKGRGKS